MANQSQTSLSCGNSIPTSKETSSYIADNLTTYYEKVLDKVATIQARKLVSQTQDTANIDRHQTKPKTIQYVPSVANKSEGLLKKTLDNDPKPSCSGTVPSNHQIAQSIDCLFQNQLKQWTLLATVIEKSQRKPTEDEKRFCFTLKIKDCNHKIIQVIGSGEECDKWYDYITTFQEYQISNGDIRENKLDSSDYSYEIVLNESSDFKMLQKISDTANIATGSTTAPKTKIKMVPNSSDLSLRKLLTAKSGTRLDLIGIVHRILGENSKLMKCCYLVDQSKIKFRLQISRCKRTEKWYPDSVFKPKVGQVVRVREVRVGHYLSFGMISSSKRVTIETDPDIPETKQLIEWYNQKGGKNEVFHKAGWWRQMAQIKLDNKI